MSSQEVLGIGECGFRRLPRGHLSWTSKDEFLGGVGESIRSRGRVRQGERQLGTAGCSWWGECPVRLRRGEAGRGRHVAQVRDWALSCDNRASGGSFSAGEECGAQGWGKSALVVSGGSWGADGNVKEAVMRAVGVITGRGSGNPGRGGRGRDQ